MSDRTRFAIMPSPIGRILLAGDGVSLSHVSLLDGVRPLDPAPDWLEDPGAMADATYQMKEYFGGLRVNFDLRLAPRGTAFQIRVWQAVQAVPYGQTISYAGLARQLNKPTAVRAVGAANGRNPLPIVVPCHRVIGSNGDLTGYGAGIAVKRELLELERRVLYARSRAEWLRQSGTDLL